LVDNCRSRMELALFLPCEAPSYTDIVLINGMNGEKDWAFELVSYSLDENCHPVQDYYDLGVWDA
jgi:hypothetical protein